jgi:hypothetical protein
MATTAQVAAKHPGAFNRIEDIVSLAVTATANTDFALPTPPAGARNVAFRLKTVTAFGAATDAQLQIGKTAGGAEYVAAVSIKSQQDLALTEVGSGVPDLETWTGSALTARIVQSGAASATGQAYLYIAYSLAL